MKMNQRFSADDRLKREAFKSEQSSTVGHRFSTVVVNTPPTTLHKYLHYTGNNLDLSAGHLVAHFCELLSDLWKDAVCVEEIYTHSIFTLSTNTHYFEHT